MIKSGIFVTSQTVTFLILKYFKLSIFVLINYSESFVFSGKSDRIVTMFRFVSLRSGPFQPSITMTETVHHRDRDNVHRFPWSVYGPWSAIQKTEWRKNRE
jgi:hypothetical protein